MSGRQTQSACRQKQIMEGYENRAANKRPEKSVGLASTHNTAGGFPAEGFHTKGKDGYEIGHVLASLLRLV